MPLVSLADLQTRVYSRLDNNTRLYPADKVTDACNEAIKILNLMTGLFQTTIQLVTYPNRHWYSIQGQGIVFPSRCQLNNTYLEKTSFLQIARGRPQWLQENTANQITPVTSWMPIGFDKIAIWPADSIGGNLLYVTGCAEPPVLVNPTDTINLNNAVFAAFDEYTSALLPLKESPKTFAQASTSYQAFLRIAKTQVVYRSFIAPRYWIAEAQQPVKRA